MRQNFSGETFPGETFPGDFFRGNCEMHLPNSYAGLEKYGASSYPSPALGPEEVALAAGVGRDETCRIEICFASREHEDGVEHQPGAVLLAPGDKHGVQTAWRAYWQVGRPKWGEKC